MITVLSPAKKLSSECSSKGNAHTKPVFLDQSDSLVEILKKMKLKSDNYNLCVEIPLKVKSMGIKYDCYPCIERKRFADKKKVKAFKVGFEILIYLIRSFINSNFIYRK